MDLQIEFSNKTFENKKRKPEEFVEIATEIRRDIIKSLVLAKSGHSGGPLGISDLMAVLFFGAYMNYDSSNWKMGKSGRFVFCAGTPGPFF